MDVSTDDHRSTWGAKCIRATTTVARPHSMPVQATAIRAPREAPCFEGLVGKRGDAFQGDVRRHDGGDPGQQALGRRAYPKQRPILVDLHWHAKAAYAPYCQPEHQGGGERPGRPIGRELRQRHDHRDPKGEQGRQKQARTGYRSVSSSEDGRIDASPGDDCQYNVEDVRAVEHVGLLPINLTGRFRSVSYRSRALDSRPAPSTIEASRRRNSASKPARSVLGVVLELKGTAAAAVISAM